jgi:membrane protein YdbS with pleckstrin-like domain
MDSSFTNDAIDTTTLPKFEDVMLTPIHKDYWKVTLFNLVTAYIVVAIAACAVIYMVDEPVPYLPYFAIGYAAIVCSHIFIERIGFKNKAYAFRTHDVIYRSGAISLTTTIIPYNRVQHAALYEGWLARRYNLASVEVYTAGGANSDIKIPGLEKDHAENIKQLLMGKILKQDNNE